jgi:hypothetical protein
MRLRPLCQTILCLLVVASTAATARAQSGPGAAGQAEPNHPVEITTFVALGSPASSKIGAAIAFAWTSNTSLEVEVGYQRGDMGALNASVNLLHTLPRIGRVVPYLAGGVGLAKSNLVITGPDDSVVALSEYALTVNAGGGVKVPVDENWGFRTDARWFHGFGRTGDHWRISNGITFGTGKR